MMGLLMTIASMPTSEGQTNQGNIYAIDQQLIYVKSKPLALPSSTPEAEPGTQRPVPS
jgi:hypothetical protein